MGILSGLQQFHGAGEGASEAVIERYGHPVRSLYTEAQLFDLHQRVTVMDEQGRTLYWTKSAIVSIRGKTDIYDAADMLIAHLEKKPISLHEKHYITMADGRQFTLSNELFHVFKDVTNIEGLDWQLKGNVIGLNFTLYDQNGDLIAAIGQKAISIHNRFSIDLYQPQHEKIVVAVVIALQKMLAARRENSSSTSSDND